MTGNPLVVGDVVKVDLPEHDPKGKEQQGHRPAVVVGLPGLLGKLRFPMVAIVPLTSDKPEYTWARANPDAYPPYPAGVGGLTASSFALLDQVRTIDAARLRSRLGQLTTDELRPITDGLRRMFAF